MTFMKMQLNCGEIFFAHLLVFYQISPIHHDHPHVAKYFGLSIRHNLKWKSRINNVWTKAKELYDFLLRRTQ